MYFQAKLWTFANAMTKAIVFFTLIFIAIAILRIHHYFTSIPKAHSMLIHNWEGNYCSYPDFPLWCWDLVLSCMVCWFRDYHQIVSEIGLKCHLSSTNKICYSQKQEGLIKLHRMWWTHPRSDRKHHTLSSSSRHTYSSCHKRTSVDQLEHALIQSEMFIYPN